jgi:4,5-DOPA dioxygenase extradiol
VIQLGPRLPTVFVSHGAPTLAIEATPAAAFLARLGRDYEQAFGRPRAILCVSAHWETASPAVSVASRPATIHDFFGFPAPLYRLAYPAPGAPQAAHAAAACLAAAGLGCDLDPERGLDHGAWIPLGLMWPGADIPVAQLSIQSELGPDHHHRVGQALAPLRDQGVLIFGSGGAVHNVGDAMRRRATGDAPPPAWAVAFDAWLDAALAGGRWADLADYRRLAPDAALAHPSEDHLLPLFVAAGAARHDGACVSRRLHAGFEYGSLSMAAWRFGGAA